MNNFEGKKIVLGVTGGIAAYKAVEIASLLKKSGAEVHVIMTEGAQNFVTPLTFREITGQAVSTTMWEKLPQFHVEHIALAKLADLIIVAPATANIIAKIAVGIADDLLTTTILATKANVVIAPAMNNNMYENSVTQRNIDALKKRGFRIIPPASGILACGVEGVGRLPEPREIIQEIAMELADKVQFAGKKILVTAAGTQEPIDPVRYIGNHSSGKMGYAIAAEAARRGAEVVLISGPSVLQSPFGCKVIRVTTAEEMRREVLAEYADTDIVIKAAAVADYRVKEIATHKIKKSPADWSIALEKNPDILYELGQKKNHQILVGFAAETQNLIDYAKVKLEQKNLDFIIANDVSKKDAGFNAETNCVQIIDRAGNIDEYPLLQKKEVADIILDRVWAFSQKK